LGNEYIVNVDIGFNGDENIISIKQTLDYVSIYLVVKKQMATPTRLLETLAQSIVEDIKTMDKRIQSIVINIKKINPPIKSFSGNVAVTYSFAAEK